MPDRNKTSFQLPELPPARHVAHGGESEGFVSAFFTLGNSSDIPLVLCHGLAANAMQFVRDAHWFARQGYFVIVPDLRGHGRSRFPDQLSDADFSLDRLATDLVVILDNEGIEKTHWVGNSLGGIMGLCLMRDHRDRLDRFVSFGTSYRLNVPGWAVSTAQRVYKLLGTRRLAGMAGRMVSPNPKTRAIARAMGLQTNIEVILHLLRSLSRYDLRQAAFEFDGPMLMIQGERDSSINKALKKDLPAMDALINFERVRLADAGHCANLDQPEQMRRIIGDFLVSSS